MNRRTRRTKPVVKVKVNRVKLLKELEAIQKKRAQALARATAKAQQQREKAYAKLAKDLRDAADNLETIHVSTSSRYRGDDEKPSITVEVPASVHLPGLPQRPYDDREIDRMVALLSRSDEETVVLTENDLNSYGLGALVGEEE